MRILALIPARGGSKGIPRKNLKKLNGIPLVGYTIAAGLKCKLISKLVVSTEDAEIAEISKSLGAQVPFRRPDVLANDESPTIDTVVHALEYFQSKGEIFDAVCLLQPTIPFRTAESIDEAIRSFADSEADSLISVDKIPHQFNPYWSFIEGKTEGFLERTTGNDHLITRRQDLPKAYYRNGSIYLTKANVIFAIQISLWQ